MKTKGKTKRRHTPEPWVAMENALGEVAIFSGDRCICYGFSNDSTESITPHEQDANAALVAAAPVMFKALKRVANFAIQGFSRNFGADERLAIIDGVHAAIADAKNNKAIRR